jgi:hypothetical protein
MSWKNRWKIKNHEIMIFVIKEIKIKQKKTSWCGVLTVLPDTGGSGDLHLFRISC